ncbi:MAG: hypothetical protein ACP5OC_07965 [Thermoplasmata archaeon]
MKDRQNIATQTTPSITMNISIYPYATTLQLEYAFGQVWSSNPPNSGIMSMVKSNNNTPLFQFATNYTGKITVNAPSAFLTIAKAWSEYFSTHNQTGARTSLEVLITYVFAHNSTSDLDVFYSNVVQYNPVTISSLSGMNIHFSPNLSKQPRSFSNGTLNLTNSQLKAYFSQDPVNGEVRWVLTRSTEFSNVEIPVVFANLTGGNDALITDFSIGTTASFDSFTDACAYNTSNSYSFYMSTNTPYSIPAGAVMNREMPVYSPQQIKSSSSGYIYLNGTMTVNRYQEQVYQCFYSIYGEICMWVNKSNFETIIGINSLEISNGFIESGFIYDAYNPYSPYTSQQAISALKWDNALVSKYSRTIQPNGSVQWGSIFSSVTGNANNVEGTINGIVGLGLSVIGVITAVEAADGWSPGSGWGNIAATTLAVSGLVSSIIGLVVSGSVNVSSSTGIMTESYSNFYQYGNNPADSMEITIYAINSSINYDGGSYTFPIMYGIAGPA